MNKEAAKIAARNTLVGMGVVISGIIFLVLAYLAFMSGYKIVTTVVILLVLTIVGWFAEYNDAKWGMEYNDAKRTEY